MTPARFASLERGLNSAARKVLMAVPMGSPTTIHGINNEIERMGGTRMAHDVVEGCLGKLEVVDLVKGSRGLWQRIPIKEPIMKAVQSVPPAPANATSAPVEDPLLNVGDDLRKIAHHLEQIADTIDETALSIDARIAAAQAGSEKLKTLKALLSTL